MKYRQKKQEGLFDKEFTLEALSRQGNPLKALDEVLDFEQFRPILEDALDNKEKKSKAGRKPLDPVFLMKVMFLQRLYNLSDEQAEFQITDRTRSATRTQTRAG